MAVLLFLFVRSDLSYLIKIYSSMFGNLKIYSRTFALASVFYFLLV